MPSARIDRLVADWAARAPDRIAVVGDERTTYAELDRLANRFAHVLRAAKVAPGDRVGVHLPRSARAIAAMLGAARAGAVWVPLDPSSPPARVRAIASDCGLRHVVISPVLLANWHAASACDGIEHFFLGAAAPAPKLPALVHDFAEVEAADAATSTLPPPGDDPDELAYLLYTSGSTGTPKGVMLSHRNALAFTDWARKLIALGPADRVASVAPFHFDLSVFDVWATLASGATLVIVDEATVLSGPRMLDRIRDQGITVWYSVPSALMLMLDHGDLAERGAPSLRVVFFAGEVFPIQHLRRAMAALPAARFHNLFGPTETNVCLAYALPAPPAPETTAIPIGRPSCGDTVAILGEDGQAVPDGEVGELFVDGPTVMLGYWNGGQRTPAPRPYPTGDFVARRPDGEIMYHGRRDHMVKIRGFRVELGEVEAALAAHPGIRETAAFAIEGRLSAAVLPADPDLSVLAIKRHAATRLPPYMIPSEVRILTELPRTSSGKIDRVRLAAALAGPSPQSPRNALEKTRSL
jgi:amino acid adenylation domain-containing protein